MKTNITLPTPLPVTTDDDDDEIDIADWIDNQLSGGSKRSMTLR